MHLSSFFSLSCGFFVLHLCKLTLAVGSLSDLDATYSALDDPIACPGPPPDNVPHSFLPPPQTLLQLCASKEGYEYNMGCGCVAGLLLYCGLSRHSRFALSFDCLSKCNCGDETIHMGYLPPKDLDSAASSSSSDSSESIGTKPSSPVRKPTDACRVTCTSVIQGCRSQSTRDCTCFAPPVGLFYWHVGDCSTRLPFKAKRDLAQQRHSYYLNATLRFASSNKATAPAGPLPDHAAQLASGLLPSPCNASYVSFACGDSPDGIVHEPPQNWLGALLPKGTKKPPPVPERFLSIHGIEEGKLQVAMAAVD